MGRVALSPWTTGLSAFYVSCIAYCCIISFEWGKVSQEVNTVPRHAAESKFQLHHRFWVIVNVSLSGSNQCCCNTPDNQAVAVIWMTLIGKLGEICPFKSGSCVQLKDAVPDVKNWPYWKRKHYQPATDIHSVTPCAILAKLRKWNRPWNEWHRRGRYTPITTTYFSFL